MFNLHRTYIIYLAQIWEKATLRNWNHIENLQQASALQVFRPYYVEVSGISRTLLQIRDLGWICWCPFCACYSNAARPGASLSVAHTLKRNSPYWMNQIEFLEIKFLYGYKTWIPLPFEPKDSDVLNWKIFSQNILPTRNQRYSRKHSPFQDLISLFRLNTSPGLRTEIGSRPLDNVRDDYGIITDD